MYRGKLVAFFLLSVGPPPPRLTSEGEDEPEPPRGLIRTHPRVLGFFWFLFWPRRTACGILLPQPGVEPPSPAVEARSLNHWTAGEVPTRASLMPWLAWGPACALAKFPGDADAAGLGPESEP